MVEEKPEKPGRPVPRLKHLDERIKLVWLMPEIIFILLAWPIGSVAAAFLMGNNFDVLIIFEIIAALVIVVGVPSYIWIHLTHENFTFELGETELIIHDGVITRHRAVIPYRWIQNITTERTLFERALGLATLRIETAGHNPDLAESVLPGIANREELISEILRHVESAKQDGDAEERVAEERADVSMHEVISELREIKDLLRHQKKELEPAEKLTKFAGMHEASRIQEKPEHRKEAGAAEEKPGKKALKDFIEKLQTIKRKKPKSK